MIVPQTVVTWVLCAGMLAGCAGSNGPIESCSLGIENVSVVPMDGGPVLPARDVRIAAGKIVAVAPHGQSRGRCDRSVDGRNMHLVPGLNDMHVHVESAMFAEVFQGESRPVPLEDALFVYLAHGVTGIRVMSGAPDILAFRDSDHGPSPRLLVATPMLSGEPPVMPAPIVRVLGSADEAVAAIDAYATAGYDFVKVRDNLGPEVLRAVMAAAARQGLEVDGHLPSAGDPFAYGRRGVAHVDELALRVEDESRDPREFARRLRACNCYVTTTLSVEKNVAAQLRDYDSLAARPATRYVHPLMRQALWERERNPYLAEGQDPRFFDELLRIDGLLLRAFREAGVPLLAGTDALVPMIIPGESLHDELDLLVAAGLSRIDALRSATRTPAEIFPRFGDLGLVAPGRAANLLLVRGNPVEDLGVLRRPEAVIVEGRFLDRAEIDRRLGEIAREFAALDATRAQD